MLQKKWIFISLLSTFLWAENNETNISNESNIFTIMSNFFGRENTDKNASDDSNIRNIIKNSSSKVNSDMSHFNGAWHLRVMDGMEVRKARAILDFTFHDNKTELSGFDGCNRISAEIKQTNDANLSIPIIISTKMACRNNIHRWVSKRLHITLKENFTIKEEKKYGIEGITLKSPSHELFFKRMGRD